MEGCVGFEIIQNKYLLSFGLNKKQRFPTDNRKYFWSFMKH